MTWKEFDKYNAAFKFIIKNKPKLIVEYGSGGSTYFLQELLNELDYGGKLISFEDNEKFYDKSCSNIRLVKVEIVDRIKGSLRYVHDLDLIKDVELVIIDGPDYQRYLNDEGNPTNLTLNLQDIVEHLNKEVPFFIDGRTGCINYYNNVLGYKTHIEQPEEDRNDKPKI